jgi:hypothetical protein
MARMHGSVRGELNAPLLYFYKILCNKFGNEYVMSD